MTSDQFVYWLHGYLVGLNAKINGLCPEQVKEILSQTINIKGIDTQKFKSTFYEDH